MWQRAVEHLQHMLSNEQRIDDSIEASSKACGRHLWLGNKMPGLRTGPLEFRWRSVNATST